MSNNGVSTKRIDILPDIDNLKKLCQSLMVLQIIYEMWSFSYNYLENGITKFEMDNGQGDFFHIYFTNHGSIIIGFANEYKMNPSNEECIQCWPGVIDDVPVEYKDLVKKYFNPKYDKYTITFCIWKKYSYSKWRIGKKINFPPHNKENEPDDGSEYLLYYLDADPKKFINFAKKIYSISEEENGEDFYISDEIVKKIYQQEPLNQEFINIMNPNLDEEVIEDIFNEIERIEYPNKFN
jgi:hypothetical protein